jgi:hypothetical protein
VTLIKLEKAELNGRRGVCGDYDFASQRWAVDLADAGPSLPAQTVMIGEAKLKSVVEGNADSFEPDSACGANTPNHKYGDRKFTYRYDPEVDSTFKRFLAYHTPPTNLLEDGWRGLCDSWLYGDRRSLERGQPQQQDLPVAFMKSAVLELDMPVASLQLLELSW